MDRLISTSGDTVRCTRCCKNEDLIGSGRSLTPERDESNVVGGHPRVSMAGNCQAILNSIVNRHACFSVPGDQALIKWFSA